MSVGVPIVSVCYLFVCLRVGPDVSVGDRKLFYFESGPKNVEFTKGVKRYVVKKGNTTRAVQGGVV